MIIRHRPGEQEWNLTEWAGFVLTLGGWAAIIA